MIMVTSMRPLSTILVAEDDRLLRSLALEVLREEGYQAVGADSGAEALASLLESPDFELLISDINMPGMNGLELARLAKARIPALKILIISGRERVEAASLPQPMAFLPKPFSASRLLVIVRHLLSL